MARMARATKEERIAVNERGDGKEELLRRASKENLDEAGLNRANDWGFNTLSSSTCLYASSQMLWDSGEYLQADQGCSGIILCLD